MFQNIVSRLSFSPALVNQLGFYAHRLNKERVTRRLGLIFVVLALVVQLLAVFQPPQAANAASSNDFISGGLGLGSDRSLSGFLSAYDKNENHLQDIFTYFGVTRSEITTSSYQQFTTGAHVIWGFESQTHTRAVNITNAHGATVTTVYGRPLGVTLGSAAASYGYVGYSAKIGWFAISQANGNLVTNGYPTTAQTGSSTLSRSLSAMNISQGNVSAETTTAVRSDHIRFVLTAKNTSSNTQIVTPSLDIGDTLEYATLVDNGGATYNETTHILSWPSVTLTAGESTARSYEVQVLSPVPATPTGQSNTMSYDCRIEATYGSDVTIAIGCPTSKIIESVVSSLPTVGTTANLVFGAVVLAVASFFYFRSRQLTKEIRIIRHDINGGTIAS